MTGSPCRWPNTLSVEQQCAGSCQSFARPRQHLSGMFESRALRMQQYAAWKEARSNDWLGGVSGDDAATGKERSRGAWMPVQSR